MKNKMENDALWVGEQCIMGGQKCCLLHRFVGRSVINCEQGEYLSSVIMRLKQVANCFNSASVCATFDNGKLGFEAGIYAEL